jgi:hypothetical protein
MPKIKPTILTGKRVKVKIGNTEMIGYIYYQKFTKKEILYCFECTRGEYKGGHYTVFENEITLLKD